MSLNCVTAMRANETGRLVKGVTLVTPVTPVLEGGWICALLLPFQIGPTPHCWPLVNQDDGVMRTADMQCHWLKVD